MNMTEKLDKLMEGRGINRKQLSEQSGIPYTTIVNFYDKGTDNVKLSTLRKLANYFSVSLDYIADDDFDDEEISRRAYIRKMEERHMEKYHILSIEGKKAADKNIDTLLEYEKAFMEARQTNDEQAVTREMIRVYDAKAAAGLPLPIMTDGFTMVTDATVPKNANFGIVLAGDSMEPEYPDGCTVWVRSQPDLENGDIGIFTINGEAVCKKLYQNGDICKLLSLNPKYTPIEISEDTDMRTYGKVIGHD